MLNPKRAQVKTMRPFPLYSTLGSLVWLVPKITSLLSYGACVSDILKINVPAS
jgi:hypothetical protein